MRSVPNHHRKKRVKRVPVVEEPTVPAVATCDAPSVSPMAPAGREPSYDPASMHWLSIVNYATTTVIPGEREILAIKIDEAVRADNIRSTSAALVNAVRYDKARSAILVWLVFCTKRYAKQIPQYGMFLNDVKAELIKRKYRGSILA